MQPSGVVTITTDFGSSDSYVGIMKGVILSVNRAVQMVDITHEIKPQNIQQAAYMVQTFYRFFPQGTVHVIVVDPGVGSERQAIALQTPDATFVAPDNGVLTYAYREALARWGADLVRVHALAASRFWLPDVSSTFHGRDVFAPVAAHLSKGVAIEDLGPRLDSLHEAQLDEPSVDWRGALVGQIIHVDHFGNYITNICPHHLAQFGSGEEFTIEILDERITKLCNTYADGDVGVLIALFGSSGRLELSVRNGSAAHLLGVGVGDNVKVWPA